MAFQDLFARSLAIDEREFGREHHGVLYSLLNYGHVLVLLGDPERGAPLLERAVAIGERASANAHRSPECCNKQNAVCRSYAAYVSLVCHVLVLGAFRVPFVFCFVFKFGFWFWG